MEEKAQVYYPCEPAVDKRLQRIVSAFLVFVSGAAFGYVWAACAYNVLGG